jgi:cytochrome P450
MIWAKACRVRYRKGRQMSEEEADRAIVTPVRSPGFLATLLGGPALLGLAARTGARLARRSGRPFRIGKRIVAARHDHVRDLLVRDLEFGIAAVNAARIGEVNDGPFVLGMDRSSALEKERRALYAALSAVDMDRLRQAAAADVADRLGAVPAGGTIDAVGGYARPIAARTAQRLFGITGPNDAMFMEVVRSVFAHTFLNQSDDEKVRERGIEAGRYMGRWLADEIARRRSAGDLGEDMMGALLSQGQLDDDGVRRTLGGMLVGSIDTTATCVAKILKVAGADPELRFAMRRDRDDPARMDGWCNEALRRWPHNPIVIRKAECDANLGGRDVAAGDGVIAWTHAAMHDADVFPDPLRLRPDRDPSFYLHLGGGLHPCAGRPVNRFQIPMLVGALLGRDPIRIGRIGWAGPFPHRLDVTLGKGPA